MFAWLNAALFLIALTACQPADKSTKTVKEKIDAGYVVDFTKPGYRRPSCPSRAPDWSDVRLNDDSERERIITQSQSSILSPGKHSCFRVGAVVSINSPQIRSGSGQARINKISLVKIDNLNSSSLKGSFFAKADDFNSYRDNMRRRMRLSDEGIVTIVDLRYIEGSAADESSIKEKLAREASGDGFSETSSDGSSISNCTTPWTEILVPESFHEALLSGTLRSYYRMGDLNCLKQGQQVELKVKRGDPSKGLLKVVKIKKFRTSFLSPQYFNLGSFTWETLATAIKAERPQEWMTVMEVSPVLAPTGSVCSANQPPAKVVIPVESLSPALLQEKIFSATIEGHNCYASNQIVPLRFQSKTDAHRYIETVGTVHSQTTDGSNTELIIEILGALP